MQAERIERITGFTFLGVPVLDAFVFVLDNYARLELLVKLHDVLPPLLLNPVVGFLCVFIGIYLLDLSYKEQIKRMASEPSRLVGIDGYRTQESRGLIRPFLVVCAIVLVIVPIAAVAYSLAYKGSAPLLAKLSPPRVAYDKTPISAPKRTSSHANVIQTGNCNVNQAGDHNQASPTCLTNPPFNPNKVVITFDCGGGKHKTSPGNIEADYGVETSQFEEMSKLIKSREHGRLLEECNKQINAMRDAEWLTPYLFCSYAEFETHDIQKAKESLAYYDGRKGPGDDIGVCKQVSDFLHTNLK